MTFTETIPKFNPYSFYEESVWEIFSQPKSEFYDIQNSSTKFDDDINNWVRSTNQEPDIESNLWKSLVLSHIKCSGLEEFYFALLLCNYMDPVADTNCIIPIQQQKSPSKSKNSTAEIMPLQQYLERLAADEIISDELKDAASRLWESLQKAVLVGQLQEPDAAPSRDFGVMLAFDDGSKHLEFEILNKDNIEVYFLNRATNEDWDIELNGSNTLPQQLLDTVSLFSK